jgi:F420-dependent oxidoreductase-like protein
MVEGQEGVTWEDWVALARATEEHGFEALFRSDHYGPVVAREEVGALDAWATLAGLAAVTSRIRLGTLVSPATFRHPSVFAKSAVTVDHISGGRVEAGLGAGWNESEHERYGFPFPPLKERMDAFAEQLEIVRRQWMGEAFSFEGEHYRLTDSDPLPKPLQSPHVPLIVGGSGKKRSVALAARWADEYNTVGAAPEHCREVRERMLEACEREGRDPLTFSVMGMFVTGADRAELDERLRRLGREPDSGAIVGTTDEVVARLTELAELGVERVMLQHLLHTDLDMLELVAKEVAPRLP